MPLYKISVIVLYDYVQTFVYCIQHRIIILAVIFNCEANYTLLNETATKEYTAQSGLH